MIIWIVLLRGINVGGNNILPMKDLRALLADLGYEKVKTYIQSGNIILSSKERSALKIASDISAAIDEKFGFTPRAFALTREQLENVLESNPYKDFSNEKDVHFFFLSEPAKGTSVDLFDDIRKENEDCTLTREVFYLHAPDGIGRSKIAEKAERLLGVPVTVRNLRSVLKVSELANS